MKKKSRERLPLSDAVGKGGKVFGLFHAFHSSSPVAVVRVGKSTDLFHAFHREMLVTAAGVGMEGRTVLKIGNLST